MPPYNTALAIDSIGTTDVTHFCFLEISWVTCGEVTEKNRNGIEDEIDESLLPQLSRIRSPIIVSPEIKKRRSDSHLD